MLLRYLVHFAFVLICFLSLSAQGAHPILRHYGAKDGLPSSEVYDILQDQQGYIWVSTDNGVSRFNGYQFESFGPEQGLTDPVVFHMYEDHRGWIWMYSFRDQIFVYRDGILTEFAHADLIKSFRGNDNPRGVTWIYVDKKGIFYASVSGSGIVQITPDGGCLDITEDIPTGTILWTHEGQHFFGFKEYTMFQVPPNADPTYSRDGRKHVPFTIIRSDGTRIVRSKPYRRYLQSTTTFFHRNNPPQPALPYVPMQFHDRLEIIEVATGNTLQHIPYEEGTVISWLESTTSSLLFMGRDYANRGLSIYDRSDFREELDLISHPALRILEDNTITHLLEDRQGGVWIGTLEDGIYYIINPQLLLGYLNDPRLHTPRNVTIGSADSLWVRTQDHRVYLLSGASDVVEVPQELHFGNGYNVYYDPNRQVLLADGLLKYWDNQKERWRFIMRQGIVEQTTILRLHNQTLEFKQSKHNPDLFWMLNLTAAYRVDFSTDPPKRTHDFTLSPRQRLFSILETSKGQVFVGGMEGLYLLDSLSPAHQIMHHPSLQNRIEELAEMANQTLIIGTKGGGVLFWSRDQDTTLQITEKQGLTSSAVEQIHIDDLQQIWVGTNKGLSRIRLESDWSYTVESMTLADGLPSNEITDITSNGDDLWVATVEGLVRQKIDVQLSNGPVTPAIEQIQVNGIEEEIGRLHQLKWYEDNIRIAVTSLDFPQEGKVTYRYRFSEDVNWQTTQSPLIEVARLSPGDYFFQIQALGRNGAWSPTVSFPLHLQNPFWNNVWFWTGLIALFATIVILSYMRYYRQEALRQQQEKQLLQLETQISDLRQQAYRAQMNPHFVYNCLTAIQAFMLSDERDQLLASDYLSKFAMLTRQALEASREKKVSLAKDIKMLENYIQLEQFRFSNSFDYNIEIDPTLPGHDIVIPALLVHPYVENAILHGLSGLPRQGELSIRYWQHDDCLHITIRDNGMGIYQHQARKTTLRPKKRHRPAGLDIARQRIEGTNTEGCFGQVIITEALCENEITATIIKVKVPIDY